MVLQKSIWILNPTQAATSFVMRSHVIFWFYFLWNGLEEKQIFSLAKRTAEIKQSSIQSPREYTKNLKFPVGTNNPHQHFPFVVKSATLPSFILDGSILLNFVTFLLSKFIFNCFFCFSINAIRGNMENHLHVSEYLYLNSLTLYNPSPSLSLLSCVLKKQFSHCFHQTHKLQFQPISH